MKYRQTAQVGKQQTDIHIALYMRHTRVFEAILNERGNILGQSSDRSPKKKKKKKKNCNNIFAAEYFGMTFGILNDDII